MGIYMMLTIYRRICLLSGHSKVCEIGLPLFGLILMIQLSQSLIPEDLIKILDDVNPTILPAWDPMVWFVWLIFGYTGLTRVIDRFLACSTPLRCL